MINLTNYYKDEINDTLRERNLLFEIAEIYQVYTGADGFVYIEAMTYEEKYLVITIGRYVFDIKRFKTQRAAMEQFKTIIDNSTKEALGNIE